MGIERALLSTYDKTGLVPLAKALSDLGTELVSTGGTARTLAEAGLEVTSVEAATGQAELFDGRVKTLHPSIHAGILARRDVPEDMEHLAKMGAKPIDMVVVNLYPFHDTVEGGAGLAEAQEMIDIGGPTMLRAAAKNFQHCTPVVDPERYDDLAEVITQHGRVPQGLAQELAVQAFEHTAHYDAVISQWMRTTLRTGKFPEQLTLPLSKIQDLRYGENSHQEAAFYRSPLTTREPSIIGAEQLHGKHLSFNNIVDVDAALEAVKEFEDPAVVIIKHATPSGIAQAETIKEAYLRAFATDTYSPFGGIIAANQEIDGPAAEEMAKLFLECIVAPSYTQEALDVLTQKKNVRLLQVPWNEEPRRGLAFKSVVGGAVLQDRDVKELEPGTWKVVTETEPTADQLEDMVFAMKCVRHIKSNSVVFVKDKATMGIGGGQTSRVDASWIATHKGGENIQGTVLASDAFFPFRDGIDVAAEAGVAAIVQPGGSIRDEETIQAANEHGIAMVFTGQRAFRH
ncbi:MAG: bifunctional phosphoribosylaminoimidazolecarboxamide formyltransferase/IMP cyclohydrolase [Candidatus Thermoplasmatota archaeon]|nr:bifunctional phosphoribosylaminoimidazolecarboxamide formyltransferase/IMP cyclohydrolase [Candidatus Thermoplasmatota archaeon]